MAELLRSLDLQDLVLIGLISILGGGAFDILGKAVRSGGRGWILALLTAAAVLFGVAHAYANAFRRYKVNTAETDVVGAIFGRGGQIVSALFIVLFGVISMSTMLVFSSHLLFPRGKWLGQVAFAIAVLIGLAILGLQGIQENKPILDIASWFFVLILGIVAALGFVGVFRGTGLTLRGDGPHGWGTSLLSFFFILAGIDTLMKFGEEAKDPEDMPRTFYISVLAATVIILGAGFALTSWLPHLRRADEDNAIGELFGHFFGSNVERTFPIITAGFLMLTSFIFLLAVSRYIWGLGKENSILSGFTALNNQEAPWKAILAVLGLGILTIWINNVDRLVRAADFFMILGLLLVVGSVAVLDWRDGSILQTVLHGGTATGLIGILGANFL
jgi:amino acid transporter